MLSYSNGKYIPTEELAIPIVSDTTGIMRGFRIFTTCKTVGGKIFRLNDHIDRLFYSAEEIHMELPHTKQELRKILEEVTVHNHKNQSGNLLLKIIYSGGSAALNDVTPIGPASLYVIVSLLEDPPAIWYEKGIAVASYPYQRQWAKTKLLNYIAGVIAHQTVAKEYKADEVLFISPDEHKIILEGVTFNFFIVRDNTIITHPLNDNILAGVTRKVALEVAQTIPGLKIHEDCFSYNDLKNVDEAFMTSSTRNVVPVIRVDDIIIANGKPGKITKKMQKAFLKYQEEYAIGRLPG